MNKGKNLMKDVDGLLSTKEAANQWFLRDSTVRKAIQENRLKEGIDIVKVGSQWLISKEAMEREYGEMKISDLSSELKRKIIDMILEDRIKNLNKNIEKNNVENGYEFVLRELFNQSDWRGVAMWPGNWRLGSPFATKVKEKYEYIERIGDDSDGVALYKINLDKYPSK